jgi:kynureninase
MMNNTLEGVAAELDQQDKLARFRYEFNIPRCERDIESVYLCGNSLGLLAKRSEAYVREEMDKWAKRGVEGHFEGKRPWADIDQTVVGFCAELAGAKVNEVAVMNSLTVNLHLLMVSFYRPSGKRFKIICEAMPFPSDTHALESQIKLHGLDPKEALVRIPQKGDYLTKEEILQCIREHAESTALILLPGVQYYTGQVFPLQDIAKLATELGIPFGVDLAHAMGNVVLKLHDWGVDFAAWCSYKYLNSGPGGIAGIFVHERNSGKTPRLEGWWGQALENRFLMGQEHVPLPGAGVYQLSNPAVLPVVSLLGSLELFHEAGIENLRAKSVKLTQHLEDCLKESGLFPEVVKILTPSDARGCQLSLWIKIKRIKALHKRITELGVICDVREPNVIRIAPVPLYNTFTDVVKFVRILKQALEEFQNL